MTPILYQVLRVRVWPPQDAVHDAPVTVEIVVTAAPVAMLLTRVLEVDGPVRRTALQFASSGVPGTVADTIETREGCGVVAVTVADAMTPEMSANVSAKTNRNDRPDARWAPLCCKSKPRASSLPEPRRGRGTVTSGAIGRIEPRGA